MVFPCPEIRQLPNTAFAIPLGLGAQSSMWKALSNAPWARDHVSDVVNKMLWFASLTAAGLIAPSYLLKCLKYPKLVRFELNHPVRGKFVNLVQLLLLVLSLSCPNEYAGTEQGWRRTIFMLAFVCHILSALQEMNGWMFSPTAHLGYARIPYLLTPIGWFLLCVVGQQARIEVEWGIDLEAMCFGIGCFTFGVASVSIIQNFHGEGKADQGSAGLLLMVASPALAAISLAGFAGSQSQTFGGPATASLGVAVFLLMLMLKVSHKMAMPPPFMGVYWAYTLAPSVTAVAGINYATTQNSVPARVLAVALVTLASCLLLAVASRMTYHEFEVLTGRGTWGDVLYEGFRAHVEKQNESEKASKMKEVEPEAEQASSV